MNGNDMRVVDSLVWWSKRNDPSIYGYVRTMDAAVPSEEIFEV